MSAFIQLTMQSRKANYLRFEAFEGVEMMNTKSKVGIEVRGGSLTKFGGIDDGVELVDGVVRANSKAILRLGRINPSKYQTFVAVCPQFYSYAQVFAPQIIEPGDEQELNLVIHAFKQLDVNYLSHILRLYLLD